MFWICSFFWGGVIYDASEHVFLERGMDFGVRYFQTNRLSMLQNSRVAYPLRATNMLRKKR
jgi:hypothetical protein